MSWNNTGRNNPWGSNTNQWGKQSAQGYGTSPSFGTGSGLMSYSPQAVIFRQVKCMAIGIIFFIIFMWAISRIPFVGTWISNTIKWLITKLAEFFGVLNCGFENSFDDVLISEKG